MSDTALSRLVAAAIVLLLIFQIGTFISSVYGLLWGVVAAVVAIGILFYLARQAKSAGNTSFWFLMPILLLTVFFTGFMIWKVIVEESSWFNSMVSITPFMVSFAAPVVLLLIVYFELRNRAKNNE